MAEGKTKLTSNAIKKSLAKFDEIIPFIEKTAMGAKTSIGVSELVIGHIGKVDKLRMGPWSVKYGKLYWDGKIYLQNGLEVFVENINKF